MTTNTTKNIPGTNLATRRADEVFDALSGVGIGIAPVAALAAVSVAAKVLDIGLVTACAGVGTIVAVACGGWAISKVWDVVCGEDEIDFPGDYSWSNIS